MDMRSKKATAGPSTTFGHDWPNFAQDDSLLGTSFGMQNTAKKKKRRSGLFFGEERLGFERAIALLDENLDLALGGVKLFLAGG